MKTGDLFHHMVGEDRKPTIDEDRVTLTTYRLAVEFTEEEQLPARYRKRSDSKQRSQKVKEDSEIEKRFKANVAAWRVLVGTMLAKLDNDLAWRFLNLNPKVAGNIKSVTDSADFCAFIDYLILRRDKENCDSNELGGLAQLSVAFQHEVEKGIVS